MTLTEVARGGRPVELASGDFGHDPAPRGRALSVAEIQHALQHLRAAEPVSPDPTLTRAPVPSPGGVLAAPARRVDVAALLGGVSRGDTATESLSGWDDTDLSDSQGRGGDRLQVRPAGGVTPAPPALAGVYTRGLAPGWVTVVAAHSGAGASTVALAIADAAGGADRRVHLVDAAQPSRCGLVAAPMIELGTDNNGAWRRGTRARVTLDRRAGDDVLSSWPSPVPGGSDLTIVDLGSPTPHVLGRIAASAGRVVLVCRPTVPGVRSAEHLLAALSELVVVVAVVGPAKWPREVTSSAGPRLTGLRAANRLVTVPPDRRLAVSGPTSAALPKPVIAAGRVLLGLIDDAPPGATAPPLTQAPTVPGTKGISG